MSLYSNPEPWSCPFCGTQIHESDLLLMDPLSLREWEISGLCQSCQNDVFSCDDQDCCGP